MNIWFTSDYHLGHENIIRYCNRPFANAQEMNLAIIENLLSMARAGDTLYFLGDLSFKARLIKNFLEALRDRGIRLVFIKGNHDRNVGPLKEVDVYGLKTITVEGQVIVLCHYAMRAWDRSRYGSWNLHGHSHGTLTPLGRQYDVGVDNNNFMPVSFEQLKQIMK